MTPRCMGADRGGCTRATRCVALWNEHVANLTQCCKRTLLLGSNKKNSCCAASTNTHSRATHLSEYSYRQGVSELVLVDLFERNCSAEATKNSSVCVIDTFSLRVLWPFISLIEPSPDQGSTEVTPLPPERRT